MELRLKTSLSCLVMLCLSLLCLHCTQGSEIVSSTAIESLTGQQNTDAASESDVGEASLEVGTVTGNPTSKPVRQVVLQTVVMAAEPEVDDDGTSTDEYSYCSPFALDESGLLVSYSCQVTPAGYNLGVKKITLASCSTKNAEAVGCSDESAATASVVTDMFVAGEGAIQRIDIGDQATTFDFESSTDAVASAGGFLFTVSYIEQRLPGDSINPDEAIKIHPDLQGASYRICTTSEAAGFEAMASYCGHSLAQMGDILWDLDGDGKFGFMTIDNGPLVESDARSDDYASMNALDILRHDTQADLVPMFPGDAFVTLMAGFDAVAEASEGDGFSVNITFDITDTLSFLDGQKAIMKCAFSHDAALCHDAEETRGRGSFVPEEDAFVPQLAKIKAQFQGQ